jgi:hypothetical protein
MIRDKIAPKLMHDELGEIIGGQDDPPSDTTSS